MRNTRCINYFSVPEEIPAVISTSATFDVITAVSMKISAFWDVTPFVITCITTKSYIILRYNRKNFIKLPICVQAGCNTCGV